MERIAPDASSRETVQETGSTEPFTAQASLTKLRAPLATMASFFKTRGSLVLLAALQAYHPSHQNTVTGRLTDPMFDSVFEKAREIIRQSGS